jgi:ubiquitin carboxyl-terminal hydrolase 34
LDSSRLVEKGEIDREREIEIQSRLDFLTAMYSNEITPDIFRLTLSQVDCLWKCLVTELPDNYHYLALSWLYKQTNSEDLHALGLDASKHIFVHKVIVCILCPN